MKHLAHLSATLGIAFFLIITTACTSTQDETTSQDNTQAVECNDALGCVIISADQPIKIASLQVLSGDPAPLGTTQDVTTKFAVAERNNTLLGHPIEVISEDDQCTSEGGANAALRIIADPQIIGVVGSTCSGAASAAIPILSDGNLVMVSGLNTAPSLTSIAGEAGEDWHEGYFRVITNGVAQATAASRFAFEELDLTKAAIINDGDTFSVGLTTAFASDFESIGGEIVADLAINKGDENMEPTLEAIALAEAEVVFIPIFQPEADFIINQVNDVEGLENIQFIGMDSLLLDSFIESIGDNGSGMHFATATLLDTPEIIDLRTRLEDAGTPPQHGAYVFAYDATNLLLNAIEQVAVEANDGTLYIGRQALRDTLYGTSNYEGVSGMLTCDEFGDCSGAILSVGRLDNPNAGRTGVLANIISTYTFSDFE